MVGRPSRSPKLELEGRSNHVILDKLAPLLIILVTIVTITNLNHDCDRCDLPGRRPARRYRNAGPVTSLGLVARDLILLRRPGTVTPWARVRRHESLRLAETSIEPRPVPGPGGRLAARRSSQCAAARTVTVPRTGSLAHWHVTVTVTRRVRKCHWHCDSDFHRLGVTAAAGRAAVTVTVTALPTESEAVATPELPLLL